MRRLFERLRRRKHASPFEVSPRVAERAASFLLEMDEALEQIGELPGLDEFGRTRRVPPRMFPLLQDALGAFDRYVKTMVDGSELEVRCSLGCAACCHHEQMGVQAIELLNIYLSYRGFSDYLVIQDRIRELATQRDRLPCPFLEVATKRCRIYLARPISCRMHLAVTDPDWCRPDHSRAAEAVTHDLAPPDAILAIMKQIAQRLGLDQLSPILMPGLDMLGSKVLQGREIELRAELRRRGRGVSSR